MSRRVDKPLSFFFSSRRRHTRSPRDWSSDVCSSDLNSWPDNASLDKARRLLWPYFCLIGQSSRRALSRLALSGQLLSGAKRCWPAPAPPRPSRSEERRGGRGSSNERSPDHTREEWTR